MSLPCPSSISALPIKSTNFPEEPKKLLETAVFRTWREKLHIIGLCEMAV
jgi:hypothetical protein